MNAPMQKGRVCAASGNSHCPRAVFKCFFDESKPRQFEEEIPSYASVPESVRNGTAGKNMTVFMECPEWKTSGAV